MNGRVGLLRTRQEWQYYPLPADAGALSSEGEQVWAVSGEHRSGQPEAMRWEQTGWRRIGVPVPGTPGATMLRDVGVIGPDDVWVVGGVSWLKEHEYDEDGEPLEMGRPVALHWNGRSWTCHWGPLGSALDRPAWKIVAFREAETDGNGGLWVLGRPNLLWHQSGGRWTRHHVPAPTGYTAMINSLARRPGTSEVYAVGSVTSEKGNGISVSHAALWRTG